MQHPRHKGPQYRHVRCSCPAVDRACQACNSHDASLCRAPPQMADRPSWREALASTASRETAVQQPRSLTRSLHEASSAPCKTIHPSAQAVSMLLSVRPYRPWPCLLTVLLDELGVRLACVTLVELHWSVGPLGAGWTSAWTSNTLEVQCRRAACCIQQVPAPVLSLAPRCCAPIAPWAKGIKH